MTSRIPPSRRDPEFTPQRAARVVTQQTPGAGRVAAAAPVLPDAVAAKLRGKGGNGTGGASVTVSTTAPSSPSVGDLWYDTDATC